MPLSDEDREVLKLMEEANKQYEEYLAVTELASSVIEKETVSEPVYNWQSPLTLIVSKDR